MAKIAYVDSSCLVAVAFKEPGSVKLAQRLESYESLFSSNLLEAEFRAALLREEVEAEGQLLSSVTWIFPDRPLSDEIARVTAHGYLKGADLWHVACALYLAKNPEELVFETLDHQQAQVASGIGFAPLPKIQGPALPLG